MSTTTTRRSATTFLALAVLVAIVASSSIAIAQSRTGNSGIERTQLIRAQALAQLQPPPAEGEPEPIPESPAFDRHGNLYWVTVWGHEGHSLWRYDLETGESEPVELHHADDPDYTPAFPAVAVHRDGTLYAADFANQRVVSIDPDSGEVTDVFTAADTGVEHFAADDLVFDDSGALYVTDLQGDVTDPRGRVYHYTADGELNVLVDGLAAPNGVVLSPDERHLWVAEYHANRLLRMELDDTGAVISQFWSDIIEVVDNFSGPGLADSHTVDSAGNVYQAFYKGGRAIVLTEDGERIADIQLPDADEYLLSTNIAIEPGGRRAFLTAGGAGGARLYEFEALADGIIPYSHR